MCWSLYLAASTPLPEITWEPDSRGFSATELTGIDRMRSLGLSLPYKKILGSQTQCGCGFADDEDTERKPVLLALSDYLSLATAAGDIELALLWEGQEMGDDAKPSLLRVGDFRENNFPLANGFTEGSVLATVRR